MDTLFIAGIETVIGANTALRLADQYRVLGCCLKQKVSLNGCQMLDTPPAGHSAIVELLESCRPQWVLFCGPAARNCWEDPEAIDDTLRKTLEQWAGAAREAGCGFTYVSSDGIYTGPWMFHEEECQGYCPTSEAEGLRELEKIVQDHCPEALMIRTHAYGWSPTGEGWLESLMEQLENGPKPQLDCLRHATPILATDLADIMTRAWQEQLTGIFHVAGSERVNPTRFARNLALQFNLPIPLFVRQDNLLERPCAWGAGETSLQTRKVRKALCVAMPTLQEGLDRLKDQDASGYRDHICPRPVTTGPTWQNRVA